MTEDQLKRLLAQANAAQREEIKADIEQNNAVLFGQLSRHFDKRFTELRDEVKADVDRVYGLVDGLAKRVETDDHERAALEHGQKRHANWISQLAKATKTKLVPEQ
jgi:hypothetical protein